ncbi:restriction endonuclease subunit S [Shewanella marinintestina]|nr:restriction endonuclease subunit S [Shewanella marinintestina]
MRGKLVPQDKKDEPASVLLERIAAEKAQLVKDKKIKKPKALPKISEDEKPFELPNGWEFKRLNDIGIIFNGNSVNARLKEQKYTGLSEGLPFIATKDVGYGFEELDYDNGVLIPLEEPKFKVARKNSVLICAEGGSAGKKCGIATQSICFGNKLFAIEVHDNFEPKFVLSFYLTPTFYSMFSASMTGIIGGISSAKFSELLIPVPPPAEQHRIIAKVDELMSLCDALEAQTEASLVAHQTLVETLLGALLLPSADTNSLEQVESPEPSFDNSPERHFIESWQRVAEHFDTLFTTCASIDTLKQTILQLAVMGKLVEQDANDEPAAKLLERIAAEKAQLIADKKIKKQKPLPAITDEEKQFELPNGWDFCRLGEILQVISDYHANGGYKILKENVELLDDVNYAIMLRTTNFSEKNYNNYKYITELAYNFLEKSKLYAGDIIMNKIGDPGSSFYVDDRGQPMSLAMNLFLLRTQSVSSRYVFLYLSGNYDYIRGFANGTSTQTITKEAVGNLVFSLPPLEEQHRIVSKVDELMALCDQLKARLADAQTTQLHLTDAIVEQAV